jgi:Holliday junction resolvase-like predicted endonuclease
LTIERNLLISILKLTKSRSVIHESINTEAKIPSIVALKLLKKLQNDNLICLHNEIIEVSSDQRLKLAIRCIELGADVENISDFLSWQEFEEIASLALERSGYTVLKNMRFKHDDRRWEIDVVGSRKPLVMCIDCKHWHHGMHRSTINKMVLAQAQRVEAFAQSLPTASLKLECIKWRSAKFVPILLSLTSTTQKFYDNIPVVPIMQLQDFLSQVHAHLASLKCFHKEFSHL